MPVCNGISGLDMLAVISTPRLVLVARNSPILLLGLLSTVVMVKRVEKLAPFWRRRFLAVIIISHNEI
jgi:hypothetical protein